MDSAEVNRHGVPLISEENKSSEIKLTENTEKIFKNTKYLLTNKKLNANI